MVSDRNSVVVTESEEVPLPFVTLQWTAILLSDLKQDWLRHKVVAFSETMELWQLKWHIVLRKNPQ